MSRLAQHDSDTISLQKVITSESRIADQARVSQSTFYPDNLTNRCRVYITRKLCLLLERLTKSKIYLQSKHDELETLSTLNRLTLEKLLQDGYVSHWTFGFMSPGFPRVPLAVLKLQPNPQAPHLFHNLWASSAHKSHNEAMTVALAETIERISGVATNYSDWHINPSFLDDSTYIAPSFFTYYGSYDDTLYKNEYWVAGRNMVTKKNVYLPVALTHLYYQYQNPQNRTLLGSSNTNGCATYTSYDQACLRGFFELIERDGFLLHWLTTTAPKQIDLSSITVPSFQEFITETKQADLDIHLLDCSTDLGIPSLIMVLVDRKRSSILRLSGVAGADIHAMLEKLQYSIMKWPHVYEQPEKQYSWGVEGSNLESIQDRNRFWSTPQIIALADFFISGTTISFEDYQAQFDLSSIPNTYLSLRSFLRRKNITMYTVDQTTPLAQAHGLKVVRMMSPDMIDMYFADVERPINQPRLQKFYEAQYNKPLTKDTINTVPHPFA